MTTSAELLGTVGRAAKSQVYTGSDDEDEGEDSGDLSLLTDLAAMFPNVEHAELVTILRGHGGDVDATVDYLMALSLQRESGGGASDVLSEQEQFSSEIGGLPEVLPSFMTQTSHEQTDTDSDDMEGCAPANQASGKVNNGGEDALPRYEEAITDDNGYCVAGSILLPGASNQSRLIEEQSRGSQSKKRKKEKKKLKKLTGKLNIKRNRLPDYKAEQKRSIAEQGCEFHPLLQPLVHSDELEIEHTAPLESNN